MHAKNKNDTMISYGTMGFTISFLAFSLVFLNGKAG